MYVYVQEASCVYYIGPMYVGLVYGFNQCKYSRTRVNFHVRVQLLVTNGCHLLVPKGRPLSTLEDFG